MAFTVSGTVTINGTPAPNATDVVSIFAFDSGTSMAELIAVTDTTGGTGAYTSTVPDNTRSYFAVYEDGTNRGVTELGTPSGTSDWTIDAASGLAFPSTDVEEAAFVAAYPAAGPAATLIYTCQESSGDLAEAGGGPSLTASGSVTYQNAITGFTRKAVGLPDNGANTGFSTSDASLTDPSAGNYMMIVVARSSGTPAAGRGMFHMSQVNQIRVNTTPRLRMLLANDDRVVTQDLDTDVHFYFASVNESTNAAYAGWEDLYTDAVYTSPSTASKQVAIGGFDANSFAQDVLAVYVWHGTIPTRTELKARLQAHGLTVPWTP